MVSAMSTPFRGDRVALDRAVFHHQLAPRTRAQLRVVGDHDQRHALGVQRFQQAHHFFTGVAVEVAGGLVGQNQRRAP